MARLLYLFVLLFVTSCAGWPQESPQLPEKFSGLWKHTSDRNNQNVIVETSGTILFLPTYDRFKINTIWTYKTVMLEGDNACLLVKEEKDREYIKDNPKLINPYFQYIRLEYQTNTDSNDSKYLCFDLYSYYLPEEPYRLTEKDWNLPVQEHAKRFQSIPDYQNGSGNSSCYFKDD